MGTDMSKPKCKKLEKIGMIYRDFDCAEPPMIREFRNGAGPCMPCPGPGQFQGGTLQRIYFPNQCADMNPCSNRKSMPVLDACVDPCRSRCGSPCGGANSGGGGKPIYIATDCADTKSSCRQSRYRTMNTCRRDDEIYCDRRTGAFGVDPRHFTITKTYNQPIVYDDIDKNVRLPSEAELIPADRIYEIRKEKIMIKADRNSLSPLPHPRSKSSERYIDMPKSVRIIDEYRTDKSNMYDADNCDEANNSIRRQLKSRSGYLVNSDYEATSKSYLESYVDSNGTKLIADQPPQQTQYNIGGSSNGLSNTSNGYKTRLSTNEIIYVPMVKEEFIKRESKKSTDITDYRQTTIDPGTVGSADGWTTREKITNKIIIKEVCPLNEQQQQQQRQINNSYVNYETRRSPTENEVANMIYQPKKSILKNTANVDVTSEYVNSMNGQRAYTTNCKNGVTITVCCPTDDQQQQQVIVGATENPAAMDNKVVTEKKNVTYEKFYIVENMAPNGRLVNGGSSVAVNQAKRSNRMNDDSGDDEQDDDERRSKDLDEENRPKSVSYGIVKDGKFYNINDSA